MSRDLTFEEFCAEIRDIDAAIRESADNQIAAAAALSRKREFKVLP